MTNGDRFLIRRWLADAETKSLWGDKASAEAEITLAMESASALCCIIENEGQAIGYGHALASSACHEALPAGCWEAHLFIASARHRDSGYEGFALERIAEELFSTTLAVACSILVPISNEPAVRGCERAGFHWISVQDDPALGACWLMLKERPPPG
jgi:hypothetical protein